MQPVPKGYEMSVCEIKTMDNDLLLAGNISKVAEEYLQISSYSGERLPLLKFELPVKISIHNAKKGFKVIAGEVYISTDEILRIVNIENLQDFERRSFFRIQVQMAAKLIPLPDDFDKNQTPFEAPEEIPVIVENLSLSGLLFLPKDRSRNFFMGDRYVVELDLPGGAINFNIKVCRYEQYTNKPKKFGCEFYGYTQKQSDRLCGYIFEVERDIIRKKKNVK